MAFLERNANVVSTEAYEIANSLKLERDNSENLSRTPSSNGDQQKFTVSSWVKFSHINTGVSEWSTLFGAGNYATNSPSFRIHHTTNNSLQVSFYTNSAYTGYYRTDAVYRDTSAWYHFVCAIDTTQGTNTDRVKMYVNGELAPSTATVSHIAQNYNSGVNTGIVHRIGAFNDSANGFASEYVADTYLIDGQALAPTAFGETDDNGVWIPKKYTGSYGTNGFYLDYEDAADLGDDESGNGNDFTENNITAADQSTDTPTNNFAVMNINSRTNSDITTIHGGTKVSNSGSSICSMNATIGVSKGKWYWECRFANDPGNTNTVFVGVAAGNDPYVPHNSNNYLGQQSGYGSIGWYFVNGGIYNGTGTWSGPGYGNIIMVALDMDNLKLYFGKEGSWENSSNPANGTSGIDIATSFTSLLNGTDTILPSIAIGAGDYMDSMNFGGYANYTQSSAANDANGYGTFEYAPPSGYYALCTKNLSEFGG